MRDQEIIGLYEAYASIYAPQQLTEEVQIAAQYFYEMGLNEEGVDILIEELGVEEFAEFVYDIADEYVLTEARAGGAKIEVKTTKGKEIQGKPTAQSLKALRKKKTARKEAEEKASEEKPSGMKASLQRQSAVAAAAKKQPKKPGLLDRVAGAVNRGIERHNAAMAAAKETGKTIRKAAGKVGGVAKEVGKGASGAARLAGHVASKGLGEEVEEWVNSLVEEGYDLSEYTWDDMYEIYMEEVEKLEEARRADREGYERGTASNPNRNDVPHSDPSQRTSLHSKLKNRADQMGRERRNSSRYRQGGRPPLSKKEKAFLQASDRTSPGRGHVRNPNVPDTGSHTQSSSERKAQRDPKQNPRHNANRETAAESYDLFDYILEYLVAEGYADTNENALVIMANMSEEWRQSIVEGTGLSVGAANLLGKIASNPRTPASQAASNAQRFITDPVSGAIKDAARAIFGVGAEKNAQMINKRRP